MNRGVVAPAANSPPASAELGINSHVAVIVLNWRGLDDSYACCVSLAEDSYSAKTVYVVDNGSGDGSGETLARDFPQFKHIANRENLGFTRGNNAAIEQAIRDGAKYVLLLNNDTVVGADFLRELVSAALEDSSIGMVGPKIYVADPANTIWYAGGKVDFSRAIPFRHCGEGETDFGQCDEAGETDFISGCCLLVRVEAIQQIGLLDETFGYYCEDVDWCFRAKKAGWKVWYQPRARIWHKINRSVTRAGLQTTYYVHRNPLLVARRHLPLFPRLVLYWKCLCHALRFPPWEPERKAAVIQAVMHGIAGRVGMHTDAGSSVVGRALAEVQRGWLRGIAFLINVWRGSWRQRLG